MRFSDFEKIKWNLNPLNSNCTIDEIDIVDMLLASWCKYALPLAVLSRVMVRGVVVLMFVLLVLCLAHGRAWEGSLEMSQWCNVVWCCVLYIGGVVVTKNNSYVLDEHSIA